MYLFCTEIKLEQLECNVHHEGNGLSDSCKAEK